MKPTVEAMLAHPGTEKDLSRSNTVGEEKYDGTRIWAGKVEGMPFIINRRNIDYTDRLLDVIEALDGIPSEDFIIDAEACVYENGRSILEYSQKRCSTKNRVKQAAYTLKYPMTVETFDIVHLDGKDLRNHTWQSRRRVLEGLLKHPKQETIRPSKVAYTVEEKREMFDEIVSRGGEGMMVKVLHSPYLGKRSRFWLKVKNWIPARCRVVGWTDPTPGGKRDGFFASLILAKADDSGFLVYCGKVGTGFSIPEVKHVFGLLKEAEIEAGIVTARDPKGKAIPYTPVDIDLEVTVKYQEMTKHGVFRIPSMKKDKQGNNLIHYGADTIKASPGQQSDLKSLLERIAKK
jgi:bifunctional non-homologous end joining protein LigD